MNIDKVNQLTDEELITVFGNVVESYPEAVKPVFLKRPFKSTDELCDEFANHLERLPLEEKSRILRLHPILAGKSAERNELTPESTNEQKSAGLNTLEKDSKLEFNKFNSSYLDKFGFPFVICARENKAAVMMEQIQIRLQNDTEKEIITGVNEVKKICRLRIHDIING